MSRFCECKYKTNGVKYLLVSFFFFFVHHTARKILATGPGIEPTPPGVEAQSLNHWTTREVQYLD